MVFKWQEDIRDFLKAGDFAGLYRDLFKLFTFVCRGFNPREFGYDSWGDKEREEVFHEVITTALQRGLAKRLELTFLEFADHRWNGYFSHMLRNNLVEIRRRRFRQEMETVVSNENLDIPTFDVQIVRFELEQTAWRLVRLLTPRQIEVIKGLCTGNTLEQIADQIGTIRKSMVANEKKAILSVLRNSCAGEKNIMEFINAICKILGTRNG